MWASVIPKMFEMADLEQEIDQSTLNSLAGFSYLLNNTSFEK